MMGIFDRFRPLSLAHLLPALSGARSRVWGSHCHKTEKLSSLTFPMNSRILMIGRYGITVCPGSSLRCYLSLPNISDFMEPVCAW
jgi:hypothetical protein